MAVDQDAHDDVLIAVYLVLLCLFSVWFTVAELSQYLTVCVAFAAVVAVACTLMLGALLDWRDGR